MTPAKLIAVLVLVVLVASVVLGAIVTIGAGNNGVKIK